MVSQNSAFIDLAEPLGTIDFIKPDGKLCYRTSKGEYPAVFQVGTNSAVGALAAAEKV